jgi:hypothetical protein
MATIIRYVQNDYGNPITFTLQNSDGSAFNLSGYAVTFRAQFGNTSGTKVSGTMSVTNDPGGVCTYTPQSTDFNEAGSYNVQITATSGSNAITWNDIVVVAEPALPSF